jgi:PAS domain S-box-containing protein
MKARPIEQRLISVEPDPRVAPVLIADDCADDRELLRVALEGMGCTVIEAASGQQALAQARMTRPAMILSDIQMPGIDGFELCRQLQQDPDLRHVPFAFITAYDGSQYHKLAQDVGAVRVLSKPVEAWELRALVEESLSVGFVPDATQKLRRLDNETFHRRHASAVSSQLEQKVAELERLARLYKVLSRTNQAIVHITNREQLFPDICRIAVEHGGLRLAAIVLIDPGNRNAKLAAWYGDGEDSTNELGAALDQIGAAARGLTSVALSSGTSVIRNDLLDDPASTPWHEAARRSHIGAMAVYPLREGNAVVGALELYAHEPGFFTAEILPTLEEMAADTSFALGNYRREAEHNRAMQTASDALAYNRLLIASCPIGIVTYKATGAAVSANDAAARLVGATVAQLEAQNFRQTETWKTSGLLGAAEQVLATNCAIDKDFHFASTFGREGWFTGRLVPFEYQSERHLLALFWDITDRVRATQALREQAEQLQHHAKKLEASLMQTVEVATTLSEMRDPYTAGHERRVAEIAVAIGIELGFDTQRQQGLRIAGYLHDVGKIMIPSEILSKPGKLNTAEFALVKGHPQASFDILKNVECPWPVAQVALQHHERVDGSGYPQGLKGESILLEARIMAVADVIEAMASHRPYRPGLGVDKALTEIERGRGSVYDPVVVDACLKLFREQNYQLPQP